MELTRQRTYSEASRTCFLASPYFDQDARKRKLSSKNVNFAEIRGKCINFAEIGGKFINFVAVVGKRQYASLA